MRLAHEAPIIVSGMERTIMAATFILSKRAIRVKKIRITAKPMAATILPAALLNCLTSPLCSMVTDGGSFVPANAFSKLAIICDMADFSLEP